MNNWGSFSLYVIEMGKITSAKNRLSPSIPLLIPLEMNQKDNFHKGIVPFLRLLFLGPPGTAQGVTIGPQKSIPHVVGYNIKISGSKITYIHSVKHNIRNMSNITYGTCQNNIRNTNVIKNMTFKCLCQIKVIALTFQLLNYILYSFWGQPLVNL